jgi:hypothetical protein
MRDYVREFLDLDEEDLTDNVFDQFIEEGTTKILRRERQWPWLEVATEFTTVADQQAYVLADTLPTVDQILTVSDYRWVAHHEGPKYGTVSAPLAYSTFGGSLFLWPTPTTAESIPVTGYRKVTGWTAGGPSATSPLPEQFDTLLLKWGLSMAYAQQDDPELSMMHKAEFDEQLERLWRDYMVAPSHRPLIVGSAPIDETQYLLGPRPPF